jgi:hypothetical protein
MGSFITDIDVLVPYGKPSEEAPLRVPTGWTPILFDLNSGAGGAYLYLIYEKHPQDRPVTGIRVLKNDEKPPAGYQKLPVDLNKDVDQETTALFLAVAREKDATAITDLDIAHWPKNGQPVAPKKGYLRVQRDGKDIDLNLDADGDYIYLDYRPATK